MIIELEINGARVIVSGDNLSVNVSQTDENHHVAAPRQSVDKADYPTEAMIRSSLLQAAEGHGEAFSTICRKIGMDDKFLSGVQRGENFSVKTYQRVMDWLHTNARTAA